MVSLGPLPADLESLLVIVVFVELVLAALLGQDAESSQRGSWVGSRKSGAKNEASDREKKRVGKLLDESFTM